MAGLTLVVVVAAGCGGDDSPAATDDAVSTTGPAAASGVRVATAEVLAETRTSAVEVGDYVAMVQIGDVRYDFSVTCYEAGAGELVAIGTGTAPDGGTADLLVEASVSAPYVGIHLEPSGTIVESALDQALHLVVQDDHIRGGAIFFVQDVDLATGVGTDVGVGDVDVACSSFERGAPPGY